MPIQHKDITGANIHEPKGVDVAAISTVYVADGSGTGTWKEIDSTVIKGLPSDGGVVGKKIISDGTEGFTFIRDSAYGSMVMNNNTVGFAITAAIDPELVGNQGYTTLTGIGTSWTSENLYGVTFSTDHLIVPVTGAYALDLVFRITQFPTNNARLGVRYLINDVTYSTRRSTHKSQGTGDEGKIIMTEHIQLTAGDTLKFAIASSGSGNIFLNDCTANLKLLRQTA